MKERILEAVREISGENFEIFEDIFNLYNINEAIDFYLKYNGFSNCRWELFRLFETFYNMTEKTCKELFE